MITGRFIQFPVCRGKPENRPLNLGQTFRSIWSASLLALECVTFHPFPVLCFLPFRLHWLWFREILEKFEFQNDIRRGIQCLKVHFSVNIDITYMEKPFELEWTKSILIWSQYRFKYRIWNHFGTILGGRNNLTFFKSIKQVCTATYVKSMMMSICLY